jgi:hypothetical protein
VLGTTVLQEADRVTAALDGKLGTVEAKRLPIPGEEGEGLGNGLSLEEGGAPSMELAPGSTSLNCTEKRYKNLGE